VIYLFGTICNFIPVDETVAIPILALLRRKTARPESFVAAPSAVPFGMASHLADCYHRFPGKSFGVGSSHSPQQEKAKSRLIYWWLEIGIVRGVLSLLSSFSDWE
jgi:hypothetical protein